MFVFTKTFDRRYDSVDEILREFYGVRMKYYVKRKAYMLSRFHAEIESISNQARFIIEKCDGDIIIENKQRNVVVEELKKRGEIGISCICFFMINFF